MCVECVWVMSYVLRRLLKLPVCEMKTGNSRVLVSALLGETSGTFERHSV